MRGMPVAVAEGHVTRQESQVQIEEGSALPTGNSKGMSAPAACGGKALYRDSLQAATRPSILFGFRKKREADVQTLSVTGRICATRLRLAH